MVSCSLYLYVPEIVCLSVWCELLILCCLCSLSIQAWNGAVVTQPYPTTVVYRHHYGTGDHYLALSLALTFLFLILGSFQALVLTIAAIFFAVRVSETASKLS